MTSLAATATRENPTFCHPSVLDRRMWAGGALKFYGPTLRIGDPLERRSSIRSVTEKEGSSGPMVFVTVDHAIYGPSGLAIEERQDIVYLEIPDTYAPPKKKPLPTAPVEEIDTTETLLFRYSAVTFNAHRIHYDLAYTKGRREISGPRRAWSPSSHAADARGDPRTRQDA
ncbi:FAS1-like dehydratase domain-containing protein [Marivita sp.]|uniref:FAS1-like dehydratase domain-containing protein n=1 Tax=Marivita sp. TaxID=2003365 RepID=UPI003B5CA92B